MRSRISHKTQLSRQEEVVSLRVIYVIKDISVECNDNIRRHCVYIKNILYSYRVGVFFRQTNIVLLYRRDVCKYCVTVLSNEAMPTYLLELVTFKRYEFGFYSLISRYSFSLSTSRRTGCSSDRPFIIYSINVFNSEKRSKLNNIF